MIVLAFVLIGGGIIAFEKLGRLEDPEYTIKEALVTTPYPGATAKEVADEVTEKIEMAVQQLPQLKRVTSLSKPGVSIVTAEIEDKYDKHTLPQVWDELRRKVTDVQTQLPIGAGPSVVNDDFGDVYGILLALNGKGFSYKELEEYADFLKRELLLVPDVAKINLWGVQSQEVHVEISRQKLSQLGVSLDQVMQTLKNQNLITPSGEVPIGSDYVRINPTGDFTKVEKIGDLLIAGSKPGNLIYLKDVAKISRGYQDPSSLLVRHNQEKTIVMGISISPGGNVITLGENIKQRLAELEKLVPLGLQPEIITFQPDFVDSAISGFLVSLAEAVAIVIIVLFLFMGFRSSLIISASLLLTIFGTFIFMQIWGISLERISLGALIIALGMLVDNAIVINDGILIRTQKGETILSAAKAVVKQSMWPLFGATVIAVLAFAAIGVSQDSTGEYTRSLFQVILISLLLSWIIAISITPFLCKVFLKEGEKTLLENTTEKEQYSGWFYGLYRNFLELCIRFRYGTVAVLVILLGLSIFGFTKLENSFFPESTRAQIMVHFWLPEGTDIRKTSKEVSKLEDFIEKQKEVTAITSFIGQGAPRFMLTYSPEKSYSSYAFLLLNVTNYEAIDPLMKKIMAYTDESHVNAMVKLRKFQLGPTKEDTIEIRFTGPNAETLRGLSDQAKKVIIDDGGFVGLKDDWRERAKVLRPKFSEVHARNLGITKADFDKTLAMNYSGLTSGYYREFDKILPIKVYAPKEERKNADDIRDVYIWSPVAEKNIPLTQIVSGFDIAWEDTAIQKRNKQYTITTQATQASGNASTALERIRPQINALKLPPGYIMEYGGEYEKSKDAQVALFSKIPLILILIVLTLIFMFGKMRQPLIIMLTVPLAIIGVTVGLLATNQPFGFMALLGFLSLAGMLIKNSVVLIDQIDLEISEGKEHYQAIVDSSISRMRPVALAAITTVLGMIPLIFDVFFIGMAVTIMAGLTFATILTLIIVPVLYSIFFRASHPKKV